MTEENSQRILPRLVEDEMKESYIDYAMSVIIGRALPDVRDGLKPVHRRILYAMHQTGMFFNKPYKKSARIVGEVLGKFHPHGDSAIYDALVRMAQNFSLRYPLIKGQGNFGSIDGDNAAAMRYTEAKLSKISSELLADIEKNTVNFVDNFDGSIKEPVVLPSKLPNLLINGSSGIAVGMATNIPPHNLNEVCSAVIKLIDNPETTSLQLAETIKGPDFPTGSLIIGTSGIKAAYTTGHGRIVMRAKTEIEEEKNNRQRIIIKEIPYQVNKTMLIEQIVNNIKDKTITEIHNIRDESDREGMRIVIELKKDANTEIVLNQLYKHTNLQASFNANMIALDNNQPKLLNLKSILSAFINHRFEIITRRTEFDLRKAEERAHILEGLIIALNNINEIIRLIKNSQTVDIAKQQLISQYSLSEKQAMAILDMKLQKLISLEQDKIRSEYKALKELIIELNSILSSDEKIMLLIKEEMQELIEKYGDKRKTEIIDVEEDIDIESLIENDAMVITKTYSGYIKRTPIDLYKAQRRGGKGIIATTKKEEDIVEDIFVANNHDYVLFFTDKGNVHWLKVYKIPESTRYSKGKAIVNLIGIKDEKITTAIPVKEFKEGLFLFMVTKKGIIKKTSLMYYSRPRANGIKAINLDSDDSLVNVKLTTGTDTIIIATKKGMAIKFSEKLVRAIGRVARGVKGITLRENDEVIGMEIADENKQILTITQKGYGKRTKVSEYRLINRGGKGVINIICSERNGNVVAIKSVDDDDEILLISKQGIMIRIRSNDVSVIGRNTQGMRLMKLNSNDEVVAAAKIAKENSSLDQDNQGQ